MASFGAFLEDLLRHYGGTKTRLGKSIGISSSTVSRLLNNRRPPSVLECLRLAEMTRTDPVEVLRAGGHGEAADAIGRLFGAAARPDAMDITIVRKLRELLPAERELLFGIVNHLLQLRGVVVNDKTGKHRHPRRRNLT